jgi:hypothetical protein
MKREGLRLWVGQQKNGIVVDNDWKGAEPLWNIGIWVRSKDVQNGLKISEVADTIKNVLETKFSSYDLEISPKAKAVLDGKHDGFTSFTHSSS